MRKANKIDEVRLIITVIIQLEIQEWESILSLRPRSVLVSFGTVARAFLMPLSMKKSIAEVIIFFLHNLGRPFHTNRESRKI